MALDDSIFDVAEVTTFRSLANQIPTEILHTFAQAVELGKWPDGANMTMTQRDICLQVLILRYYQHDITTRCFH